MAVWSEISTIDITKSKRMDADFFKPEFLELEDTIIRRGSVSFGDIISTLTDYHANGSYQVLKNHVTLLDVPDYAYMVRTADLEGETYDKSVKYITEKAYEFLKKSKVYGYEILINKIGSAGKVYLMPKLDRPVSLGMNLFLIRTNKEYSTFYVYAYLRSKYGSKYISRFVNGTVPMTITKEAVRSVMIPSPCAKDHELISSLVLLSFQTKSNSEKLYAQAQQLLENELDLKNLRLIKSKSHQSKFSEIVGTSRIDADYYQTHFRQQQNHLRSLQTKPLRQIVNFTKGIEVGTNSYTETGNLFVRVSNVKETGIVATDSDKYIDKKTYDKLQEYKLAKGDVLLTKDGTLGVCYVVDTDIEGIISGGIMKMSIKDKSVPAEYLSLVINSSICRFQIEQTCSGALILHWKPRDIASLKIPILSDEIMCKLSDLVVKAKIARKESEQLLEQAKRRVEELIEGGTGA